MSYETVTVELPSEVLFPCAKAGVNYSVRPGDLSTHIIAALFRNGCVQKVGDSTSQIATSAKIDGRKVALKGKDLANAQAKAKALADECVANLAKGIWGKTRSASGDPVENRMRRLAISTISKSAEFKAFLAEHGVKAMDEKATTELSTRAAAMVESNPKFGKAGTLRNIAERQIEDEAMLAFLDDEDEAQAA